MLCYAEFMFWLEQAVMGGVKGTFLDTLLPKAKPIFVGIIHKPPNNIYFLECFEKILDDINVGNEIFFAWWFQYNSS